MHWILPSLTPISVPRGSTSAAVTCGGVSGLFSSDAKRLTHDASISDYEIQLICQHAGGSHDEVSTVGYSLEIVFRAAISVCGWGDSSLSTIAVHA